MTNAMRAGDDLQSSLGKLRSAYSQGGPAPLDAWLVELGESEGARKKIEAAVRVPVLDAASEFRPVWTQWPASRARQARCVVGMLSGQEVIASEDPWNLVAIESVSRVVKRRLPVVLARKRDIDRLLGSGDGADGDGRVSTVSSGAGSDIVRFVDDAVSSALRSGASDIHFETGRAGVVVKQRLDGVLVAGDSLSGVERAEEVVSRLKVLAKLDITERRLPQDGRFTTALGGAPVDIRVSVMPSVHGEDVVLRLLDKSQLRAGQGVVDLDKLGFDPASALAIRDLARRPSGLLLVTGPTGSGKTTTVYAALSEVNNGLEKIITIEDPVEYELSGVLQVPVNERKGLTFAKGLRSILRHDPDRLLVGEIRDAETASIAVQAALTGHVVFTTVHANSWADVIARFRHFDIDVFGFMSALNGVVVQRLLRRLCAACRSEATQPSGDDVQWLQRRSLEAPECLHEPIGCAACRGTGFRGRFVVSEVHAVDDGLRDRVMSGAPISELHAYARGRGVVELERRAVDSVKAGLTSLSEVRRVIG